MVTVNEPYRPNKIDARRNSYSRPHNAMPTYLPLSVITSYLCSEKIDQSFIARELPRFPNQHEEDRLYELLTKPGAPCVSIKTGKYLVALLQTAVDDWGDMGQLQPGAKSTNWSPDDASQHFAYQITYLGERKGKVYGIHFKTIDNE